MLIEILGKCFSIKGASDRQMALHNRADLDESPGSIFPVLIGNFIANQLLTFD
jgi:hypothetical protein